MSKISTKDIAKAIYKTAKDKSGAELERALANSVEFLVRKNLLSKSPEILRHLEEEHDRDQKIVRAKVSSKEELSSDARHKIREVLKERYKAHEIVLDEKEDRSLIGGVKIEAKDEVIDLSLKNRVEQLKNYLLA